MYPASINEMPAPIAVFSDNSGELQNTFLSLLVESN